MHSNHEPPTPVLEDEENLATVVAQNPNIAAKPALPPEQTPERPEHVPEGAVYVGDGHWVLRNFTPDPEPTDPRSQKLLDVIDPARHKRNCGRTGPTTTIGRGISARNATRHGMCARTLILAHESQEDYDELASVWLNEYGNPAVNTVLHEFVIKVVNAEWFRRRAEREYNFFLASMDDDPMVNWDAECVKKHELHLRYLTANERKFQRDYKNLEQHWKSHAKPAPKPEPEPEPAPKPTEFIVHYINNETGESVDQYGNHYPAPPNYVPKKIVPGVYDDDHPSNWHKRQPKGAKK